MSKTDRLRERAEKELQKAKEKGYMSSDVSELLHELQVHQVELQMQNEELRKSQEEVSSLYNQYHELYDYAPVGYFSLDKDGIIRNVNVKGAELLQLNKKEIIGRGFSRFIPKNDENKYYYGLSSAVDTGKIHKVELQLKRDKPLFNFQMEIMSIYGNDNEKYRIIITDITGLKQAEKTVEDALHQAESVINTVREPLVVLDADINVVSANRSFYEVFKVNPLETEGKLLYDLGNQQWNIPKLRQLLEDILPASSVFEVEEIEISEHSKNKKFFEVEENLRFSEHSKSPISVPRTQSVRRPQKTLFFEDFEITHFFPEIGKKTMLLNARQIKIEDKQLILLAIEDITKRKEIEEELKHAHENLEEKVAEQTVELKDMINELRRSNEELEKFAYVASHDLQEPLRTIASFTQLLERRYKGKFDEDADEFMDYVINAAIQMKKQVEGLLEYSRIARHGKEFRPINTNAILNQVINNLNFSIKESNAGITYDKLPIVIGDEIQLQRVFQNIISNAIRFRKCEESLKIHISAFTDEKNKEYIFSVSDNGIGIEDQYSERIFTIFQRLHTRDIYHGTGIGLSIVKRIIERHGGRVWVESKYGKGSTFYFIIPFKPSKIGGGSFFKKG